MKLIKNAIVYKAEIPSYLGPYLVASAFTEVQPEERASAGFVPVPKAEDGYCQTFNGGLAFALRYDEKVIPASAVKAEVEKQVAAIYNATGRMPGKKQLKEIAAVALDALCRRALVRSAVLTCFYDTKRGYLFVPTTSEALAGLVGSKLVQALATVKTETINVCDVQMGLTKRVQDWLADEDEETLPFGPAFELGGTAALKRATEDGTEKIRFDLTADMQNVRSGIGEALKQSFSVTELGLRHGNTEFRITHKFQLRGIEYSYDSTGGMENEDAVQRWKHDAAVQVLELRGIMDDLVEMLVTRPAADGQEGGNE